MLGVSPGGNDRPCCLGGYGWARSASRHYAVHDGLIVFRTSAYGPLAELKTPRPVAFEIDGLDVAGRRGWSVTARGPSRAATRADELVELWSHEDPAPWAAGSRTLFIVIVPHTVSGRRVSAPRDSDDGPAGANS